MSRPGQRPGAAGAACKHPAKRDLTPGGLCLPGTNQILGPQRARPFGAWNGWYVVDYDGQTGYAAAAYIDT